MQLIKQQALLLPLAQFLLITIISILIALFIRIDLSLPFWFGGLVSIIPNLWLIFFVFKTKTVSTGKRFLKLFYVHEIIKLILMGCFFLAVLFLFSKTKWLTVILGLITAQLVSLMMPFIYYCLDSKRV